MIVKTLERMLHSGTGPGGFSNQVPRTLRATGWTRASSSDCKGLSVINEAFVSGRGTLIDDQNPATYIHIDDDLFLTSATTQEEAHCDNLMETAARALKTLGFGTSAEVKDKDFEQNMRRSTAAVSQTWRTNTRENFFRSSMGTMIRNPNQEVNEALMRKTEALKWMSMDMSSAAKFERQ